MSGAVVVTLFLFGILTSLLLLKTKISLHLGVLSCSWLHWCGHVVNQPTQEDSCLGSVREGEGMV